MATKKHLAMTQAARDAADCERQVRFNKLYQEALMKGATHQQAKRSAESGIRYCTVPAGEITAGVS